MRAVGSVLVMALLLPACFHDEGVPDDSKSEINSTLRQAYVAARMVEADGRFDVVPGSELGALVTVHPHTSMRTVYTPAGVRAELARDGRRGPVSVELGFGAFGRAGDMRTPADAQPDFHRNRVDYDHGEIVAWYLHGPLGLEQGFTLPWRPQGEGELMVEVSFSGELAPRLSPGKTRIELVDDAGRVRARYQDLFTRDANGRSFASRMELSGQVVRLVVDDAGARYPLTIDPLLIVEEAKLIPPGLDVVDLFGHSVALGGNTAVVGVPNDDDAGTNSGSAYAFRWTGTDWQQDAKLTAADAAAGDEFGFAVDTTAGEILVGAPGDDGGGAAYVFVKVSNEWIQQGKLTAGDGVEGDELGRAVSMGSGQALAGAHKDDDNGTDAGAIYLFGRSGSNWFQQAKLTPMDADAGDEFGRAVGLSAGWAIAGARNNDDDGTNSGSAYIFWVGSGPWYQDEKLTASDAAAFDTFGYSVAISSGTALVGANMDDDNDLDSGSVYVFRNTGTWTEEAKLVASDGTFFDEFGRSVSYSSDTALVGAPFHDGAASDSGAAYVFVRSGTSWSEEAKLEAADAAASDRFGAAVDIAGDQALVGATMADTAAFDSGTAYVFSRDAGAWSQSQQLTAYGLSRDDMFGTASAVDGDTAVVGAHGSDVAAENGGAAYVFVRSGGLWEIEAELTASDAGDGDAFGWAVAISGDTVVIGAELDADAGVASGSAYVFTRSGTSWSQQAKLTAGDAAEGDRFGESVAIDMDSIVVGAPRDDHGGLLSAGSAYVFVRSGGTWSQQAKLVSAIANHGAYFGESVAIEGDTLAVGVSNSDAIGLNTGHAEVFARAGGTWLEQDRIDPPALESGSHFGDAIDLAGDSLLIGAPLWDVGGSDSGSAFVYTRSAGNWSHQGTLDAPDSAASDRYGWSVAIEGDTAAIGAYWDDVAGVTTQGSVHVFVRSAGAWSHQNQITAADGAQGDKLGESVALSGDLLMASAPGDDDAGSAAGAVYVFEIQGADLGTPCPGPYTCLSGNCVDGVCCDTPCAAGDPDDCQACSITEGAPADGNCVSLTGTACDDGDVCTANDTCTNGGCAGTPDDCDDGNVCTDDSCESASGCVHTDNTEACDDINVCTLGDQCAGGACTGSSTLDCDDGNECTDDNCNPHTGCMHVDGAGPCDDGDPCTLTDSCNGGICYGGPPDDCDDANVCTDDSCDSAIGCVHVDNTGTCDDGDPCTMNDACTAGVCTGPPRDMDGDGYVFDECNGTDCDDDAADVNPGVFEGPSGSAVCTDGIDNDCDGLTDDQQQSCAPCVDASDCDDGNPCNGTEGCDAGLCQAGTPPDCADTNPCTDDSCDPASGCVYNDNTAPCDDGDACTQGDTCAAGECLGTLIDADGDGHSPESCGGDDCDDTNASAHPGIVEEGAVCSDGVDNDCDGDTDDEDAACQTCSDDADCDDGDACNGGERCQAGACTDGTALDCDDGDPCTQDSCDPTDGCANDAISGCCTADADCDDGDACTTDTCDSGDNTCSNAPITDCGEDNGSGSGCGCGPPGDHRTWPGLALLALLFFAVRRRS